MIVTRGNFFSSQQWDCPADRSLQLNFTVQPTESERVQTAHMPPNMDYPVKTQMAVAIRDGVGNREYSGFKNLVGRQRSRRRVFVQTDTGSVLGIELDRSDNVHTVKKKMQIALNVPTEESALTFGDLVLKNDDLSVVRNDAPLRLTRGLLQRSSSTPCLSPIFDSQQHRDRSGPLEIVGGLSCCAKLKKLMKEAVKAVNCGIDPIPVKGGLGGAYYFRNRRGESIAIVKPTDEEPFAPNNPKGFVGKILGQPGLKRSVRVGETGVREVAAYLLDHEHFSNVPPTVLVKISHPVFNVNREMTAGKNPKDKQTISKIASFQEFVAHDFDASDHGTSSFSVAAVHRIGILDIRIFNTDRHAGNILVRKCARDFGRYPQVGEAAELTPIDHGLCLPETLEDPYFEWLHWPQASLPFSDNELEYINRLDAVKDVDMLRMELPMLRESCLRILMLCTIFLKKAAAAGLCLAEIGEMMTREFQGGEEELSELELICVQAKMQVDQEMSAINFERVADFSEACHKEEHLLEQFQFDMEEYEEDFQAEMNSTNCGEDSSYLNFGSRHDSRETSSHKRLLKVPEVTGLSCLLPQPPLAGYSPERTGLLLHSVSNGTFFSGFRAFSAASHPSSPRAYRGGARVLSTTKCSSPRTPRGCPLSKLDEIPSIEEQEMEEVFPLGKAEMNSLKQQGMASPGHLAVAKSVSFSDRKQRLPIHEGMGSRQGVSASGGIPSGYELGAVAPTCFKFSDISEEEWMLFINCFQNLLPEAFASRKGRSMNHRQRLGTSCQF